MAHGDEHH
jgi:hypothetical protein